MPLKPIAFSIMELKISDKVGNLHIALDKLGHSVDTNEVNNLTAGQSTLSIINTTKAKQYQYSG